MVKENVFPEWELKMSLRDTLTTAAIDSGKIANQTARLVAIVVRKIEFG